MMAFLSQWGIRKRYDCRVLVYQFEKDINDRFDIEQLVASPAGIARFSAR